MRIIYIAHPISGDVQGNIKKVEAILFRLLEVLTANSFPIAPYLDSCRLLNDNDEAARERGLLLNYEFFKRGIVDELWVYGKISKGVAQEMQWANDFKIPVHLFP